ncbi:hypothetical protein [Pseudohaliea sp.]|uniref:hypothetical protein n=1 Tax=Pseudohaliea sp. TaxID=2740289 RepID=UPI0032ECDAAD
MTRPEVGLEALTDDELHRLIEATPKCRKLGILDCDGIPCLTLFDSREATQPIAMVPVVWALEVIEKSVEGLSL